jgi:hypothetical protein
VEIGPPTERVQATCCRCATEIARPRASDNRGVISTTVAQRLAR